MDLNDNDHHLTFLSQEGKNEFYSSDGVVGNE